MGAFAAVYAAALVIFVIGTWGLFGVERDPLSGVFLIPLGLPWNLAIEAFPEPAWPTLGAAAPAANLLIVIAVCRGMRNR